MQSVLFLGCLVVCSNVFNALIGYDLYFFRLSQTGRQRGAEYLLSYGKPSKSDFFCTFALSVLM